MDSIPWYITGRSQWLRLWLGIVPRPDAWTAAAGRGGERFNWFTTIDWNEAIWISGQPVPQLDKEDGGNIFADGSHGHHRKQPGSHCSYPHPVTRPFGDGLRRKSVAVDGNAFPLIPATGIDRMSGFIRIVSVLPLAIESREAVAAAINRRERGYE